MKPRGLNFGSNNNGDLLKMKLTKTTIAIAVLGLSGVASAAMYAPPPAGPTWHIGFEFGGYEATNEDLWFAETTTGAPTPGALTGTHHYVDPDYEFGFSIDAGYHFDGTNDVTVGWTWFEDDDATGAVAVGTGQGNYNRTNVGAFGLPKTLIFAMLI